MSFFQTILLTIGVWISLIAVWRWVLAPLMSKGPNRRPETFLLWICVRVWCRLVHRPIFIGLHHVPETNSPGGLIVVANHTGAIDPLLIQCRCRFLIRWMMASEMMSPALDWAWGHLGVIGVSRDGRDSGPLRQAIRQIRSGKILGIFPESRIVWPPGEIRPFLTGVGMIVARTKAPVLLVWVSNTPRTRNMTKSLTSPSHARIQFVDLIKFDHDQNAEQITTELRRRLAEISGWPINDEPIPSAEVLDEMERMEDQGLGISD